MIFYLHGYPTPVLLSGKSHGQRSLVGRSPWGRWVGHNWVTSLSLFTFMHWRRKWQPTPVFLPGESQGWRSLMAAIYGAAQSRTRLKRLSSSSSAFEILFRSKIFIGKKPNRLRNTVLFPFTKIGCLLHYEYLNTTIFFSENISKLKIQKKKKSLVFFSLNHIYNKSHIDIINLVFKKKN